MTWPIVDGTTSGSPLQDHINRAARGGIYTVADDTERDELLAALTTAGIPLDADNPLYVHNQGRPRGQELERTTDGSEWLTLQASAGLVSYSPANTNLSVGNGTQTAFYAITNGIVHVSYRLQFGSTTAITGTLNIGLPAPAGAGAQGLGVGYAIDADVSGATSRSTLAVVTGTTASQVILRPVGGDLVQANQPFPSWGSGDTIGFEVSYRAGS